MQFDHTVRRLSMWFLVLTAIVVASYVIEWKTGAITASIGEAARYYSQRAHEPPSQQPTSFPTPQPRNANHVSEPEEVRPAVEAQKPEKNSQPEQTEFSADWGAGEVFISKPVEIPLGALQVIQDTLGPSQIYCLKTNDMTPEQVPASWFAASEIHLAGPEEVDLIVQPDLPKLAAHEHQPGRAEAASCLLGANVGPFWVIRKNASGRYSLLVATVALGLQVLDSRTNRYRDIQTWASTAVTTTTIVYKMYVAQYQVAEKKTEP